MSCKNCGHKLEGNYCIECGQSAKTKRINLKYILEEIPNSVFQVDHGFLYTIKELLIRPGHSLREFMEGKRKNHFKPLAFLLLSSTIYVFVSYLLGFNTGYEEIVEINESAGEFNLKVLKWIFENQSYIFVVTVPIYSLATYLAFIKAQYNYFEHLVLNIYIVGQQTIIKTLLVFGENWEGWPAFLLTLPLVFFNVWALTQFFNNITFSRKVSLLLLSYFIISVLIFFGLVILFTLLYYYNQ